MRKNYAKPRVALLRLELQPVLLTASGRMGFVGNSTEDPPVMGNDDENIGFYDL